jgi:hypothetical protein
VKLYCNDAFKIIKSGEILNMPCAGTLMEYWIEGVDKYTVTGIVYDVDLWKEESHRGTGMILPYGYDFVYK